MKGTIFDIKEFAVYDGPGIRTTAFLKGCPLRCRWCHNPEGLLPSPQLMVSVAACVHCGKCRAVCGHPDACVSCGACIPYCPQGLRRMAGYEIEAEALAARLKKSALFPDGGVTFSGGEPLMQWPFVREVASLLPGIHLAIETSGYSSDEAFSEMTEKMNLVMMDIKHADPAAHEKWTGIDNAVILRHLEFLKAGTTPFIVRVPLIPGVNDSHENLARTAELVSGAKALLRVELLPYHQTAGAKYPMAGLPYEPGFDTGRAPNKELYAFLTRGIEAISLS